LLQIIQKVHNYRGEHGNEQSRAARLDEKKRIPRQAAARRGSSKGIYSVSPETISGTLKRVSGNWWGTLGNIRQIRPQSTPLTNQALTGNAKFPS